MIYIYDILINFNDDFIDFYDWLDTDYLEHIRKIPMIKVTDKFYKKIISKQVKVLPEFLSKIKNKTELFADNKIERLEYAVLISTDTDAFVCMLDKNGIIKELSKLLIDEELEILEIAKGLEYYKLEYTFYENNIKNNKYLRSEKKIIKKILCTLNNLKEEKKEDLLKYLYYEWFQTNAKNKKYFEKLVNDIKEDFTTKHKTFLDIINITQN